MLRDKITVLLLLTLFSISFGQTNSKLMTCTAINTSADTQEITITFIVPENDCIYKDFITCSVHDPHVTLSPWKANKQIMSHYDSSFKETKQVFNETFSISMTATTKQYSKPVHLYCSYYRRSEKKINHTLFQLLFTQPIETSINIDDAAIEPMANVIQKKITSNATPFENYFFILTSLAHRAKTALPIDHKTYAFLLLLLMALLYFFSYYFREQLQKQQSLNESIEVLFSFVVALSAGYILVYLYRVANPLITVALACGSSFFAGSFYIKKSTKLRSGFLRTLCTLIGMLLIICAFFLAFKALQYADEQFHLL